MTTITIDTSVEFPKTHFKTMDECAAYMVQWNFERELDEGITIAKTIPTSKLLNI